MIDTEVALALAYAAFLVLAAGPLAASARSAGHREDRAWPRGDVERLRRGVALLMCSVAAALLCAELSRALHAADRLAIGCGLALTASIVHRRTRGLRRSVAVR